MAWRERKFSDAVAVARPPAACPVCGGPVHDQGRMMECARCRFSICWSCEGLPGHIQEPPRQPTS